MQYSKELTSICFCSLKCRHYYAHKFRSTLNWMFLEAKWTLAWTCETLLKILNLVASIKGQIIIITIIFLQPSIRELGISKGWGTLPRDTYTTNFLFMFIALGGFTYWSEGAPQQLSFYVTVYSTWEYWTASTASIVSTIRPSTCLHNITLKSPLSTSRISFY